MKILPRGCLETQGRRVFDGERISLGIYITVRQMKNFFVENYPQFPLFRIDQLLAHLQRVVNRKSLDLRVDTPASQAGATGAAMTRSPNKSRRDDSPHGASPAKQSKRDAPPRSPTPTDVEPENI